VGPTSWCKDSRINCNMGCILQILNLNLAWHMGGVHWLSKSRSILQWVGEMSGRDRINGHIGCRYYHEHNYLACAWHWHEECVVPNRKENIVKLLKNIMNSIETYK
jgi:hypothetical protein